MQLLNDQTLFHYLLEKKIITNEDVYSGCISTFLIQSRNHNFVIRRKELADDIIVKQIRTNDQSFIATLQQEATLFRLTKPKQPFEFVNQISPEFHFHDPVNHVLITKFYRGAQDLFAAQMKEMEFVPHWGYLQAKVLALFHTKAFEALKKNPINEGFKKSIPWIFKLHTGPKEWFNLRSRADHQLFSLVQKDEIFPVVIQELHNDWRIKTLIHGDIKWNNFLYLNNESNDEIKIIDWETADIGDPAWDVAGVFQSYLTRWGFHFDAPLYKGKPQFSGEKMEESLNAFWNHYVSATNLLGENHLDFLVRSIKYTAVRTIQTCLESSHRDEHLIASTAKILQMSQNMLRNPQEAAVELLGLKLKRND